MASWRYEISLGFVKRNIFFLFQLKRRNFVSPSDHVMFCVLYKYQLLYKYHSEIVSTLTKVPLRKAQIIMFP